MINQANRRPGHATYRSAIRSIPVAPYLLFNSLDKHYITMKSHLQGTANNLKLFSGYSEMLSGLFEPAFRPQAYFNEHQHYRHFNKNTDNSRQGCTRRKAEKHGRCRYCNLEVI